MLDTKSKLLYPKLFQRMALFSQHLKPNLVIKRLILRLKKLLPLSKSQKNEVQKIRLDLGKEEINQAFSMLTKTKEVMVYEEFSKFARIVRREALKNQIMTPLFCKGVLIRVRIKKTEIINRIFPDYGWQKYFKGGLKIIETDGDHMGMIRLPNIQDLAKKLNTLLK
jgi:predicted Zn-ribbon and HTH transcriptional regulator